MKLLRLALLAAASLAAVGPASVPASAQTTASAPFELIEAWRATFRDDTYLSEDERLDELAKLSADICGPDGDTDETDDRPACSRWGWDGDRYVDFCEGSREDPSPDDPFVAAYAGDGTLEDALIALSDARTNSCD